MRPRSLSAWFQPGASQLGRVRLSVLAALSASSLSARAIAATPAETAPVVSAAGSLFQVVIGLVAVLLLIAAAAWLAKRLGVSQVGTSSLLRVVSTAAVGTRERVVVVEVGESWLVVGVAPGSVNALMTLPKGDIPSASASPLSSGFAARLQHMIETRRGH